MIVHIFYALISSIKKHPLEMVAIEFILNHHYHTQRMFLLISFYIVLSITTCTYSGAHAFSKALTP